MEERPETWLDERLGASDAWSDAASGDAVVVGETDLGSIAVVVDAGASPPVGTGASWLDAVDLGVEVSDGDRIEIDAADLDGLAVSSLDDDLTEAATVPSVESPSGVVDPFDVFLAETEPVREPEATPLGEVAEPSVEEDPVGAPPTADSPEPMSADGPDAAEQPEAPSPVPSTSASRLDAFEDVDDSVVLDAPDLDGSTPVDEMDAAPVDDGLDDHLE